MILEELYMFKFLRLLAFCFIPVALVSGFLLFGFVGPTLLAHKHAEKVCRVKGLEPSFCGYGDEFYFQCGVPECCHGMPSPQKATTCYDPETDSMTILTPDDDPGFEI